MSGTHDPQSWRPETLLVHGLGAPNAHGGTLPPIVASTAFEHRSAEAMEAVFAHQAEGHVYSRLSNPTVEALEERITAISHGRGTVAVASGMSAVALALLTVVRSGDHIVAGKHVFGGTYTLLETTLARLGIRTTWVNASDGEEVGRALRDETRAVLLEAIANPAMVIPDFSAIAAQCAARSVPLLVDATLLTPLMFDAKATGADVAIYSGSKFLAGAATTIGGLIVDTGRVDWGRGYAAGLGDFGRMGPAAFLTRLRRELMVGIGPSLSPQAAFLQIVGLETLALRLERQCRSTLQIAQWLSTHPAVRSVACPALASHPDHARCAKYFRGNSSSIFSFTLENRAACFGFLNRLRLIQRAANLGDTRSLALHPASTIYHAYWPAQREDLGVPDGLIRLSVGIENVDDLLADLAAALDGAA
jgi:O-acetylhomoserine (thiol)-lyase